MLNIPTTLDDDAESVREGMGKTTFNDCFLMIPFSLLHSLYDSQPWLIKIKSH
jgi:hypothetical protein